MSARLRIRVRPNGEGRWPLIGYRIEAEPQGDNAPWCDSIQQALVASLLRGAHQGSREALVGGER